MTADATPGEPILVPLDGSSNAENALPVARLASQAFGRAIQCLHVIPQARRPEPQEEAHIAHVFSEYVEKLVDRYGLDKSSVTSRVTYGIPADVILECAAEAALIALASHGRGGFRAGILGSVADRVVRGAIRPVLLVPGVRRPRSTARLRTILVGLDGSEHSERGLALARELAGRIGAHLSVLRAYSAPPRVTAEDFLYYSPEALVPELKKEAELYLEQVVIAGEEPVTAEGAPDEAIGATAEAVGADLIVISTHGKGATRRFILGSVTDKVIRSTTLPVLIVPPETD